MKLEDKIKLLKSRGHKIRDMLNAMNKGIHHVAFDKDGKNGFKIEWWEPTEQDYKDLKELQNETSI